ncbi:PAS domain S-box protein [candidate division WOR-3 bacterium]|nr:PAS domain S-box protein [candidate division WOR-3 bacterium]
MKDKDLSAMLPTHCCHDTEKTQTGKTKEQLINELTEMRQRIADLESGKIKHKQVERALKNSEEKLRSFIDSSTVGIWCFRAKNPIDVNLSEDKLLTEFFKSTCVECNDTYANMMGTTKDKILGTVLYEVMPDTEENREYLKTFIHNGFQISGGISHEIGKNGEEKYFSNSMTAIIKNGKLIEAWGTQTDITNLKCAEQKFKAINKELTLLSQTVKSMKECVSITNKDHKIIFINKTFIETYGFKENEILGKTSSLIFSPSNPKNLKEKIRSSTMKGSWKGELLNVRKDGTEFPIELSTSILKDDKGNATAYIGISSDITERKQAEEVLQESKERYQSLIESTEDPIYLVSRDLRYIYVNTKLLLRFGKSLDEVVGKKYQEFHSPEETKEFSTKVEQVFESGKPLLYEHESKRDGKYFLRTLSPVIDPKTSKTMAVTVVSKDITELKRAEEAQQRAEKEKEYILDAQLEHVIYEDTEMHILWPNKAACDSVNMNREELIGRYCYEIWPQRDEPCEDCPVIASMKAGKPQSAEKTTSDGRSWFIRGYPIRDTEGEIIGAIEVTQDITERKRAEEALRESEEQYRGIFESAGDTFLVFNLEGEIIEANPAACKMYGYPHEELIGLSGKEIVHPDYYHLFEDFKKQVKSGGQFCTESIDVRKDGSTFNIEVHGAPYNYRGKPHLLEVVHDITERKKSEEELQKRLRELETYYKVTMGREARIVELKHQVNELLERLGEERKYKV